MPSPSRLAAARALHAVFGQGGRVPEGWKVIGARTATGALVVDAQGTADITPLRGAASVHFLIAPSQ